MDSAAEREKMISELIRGGLLRSPSVVEALKRVPRELFVPDQVRQFAYDDTPLPTDYGQTISAPRGAKRRAIHGRDNERSS